MAEKEITSLQHPLIKRAVRLRQERREREKEERVLISGKKLISDLSSDFPPDILFFHGALPEIRSLETIAVTPTILKKITGLEEPDGWAAIVHLPPPQPLFHKNYLLVLDSVSDPGNLGTLWRTALALNWEGVWLTPGCVDPFNDKALRAAQGATFRLPYERMMPDQIVEWAKTRNASLICADLAGPSLDALSIKPPLSLLLGSEGQGLRPWTSLLERVTIPMASCVESLNVASAGAILLYAMRPKR